MSDISASIKLLPGLLVVVASVVSVVLLIHQPPVGLQVIGLIVTVILGQRAALQLRMANGQYLADAGQDDEPRNRNSLDLVGGGTTARR